MRGLQGFDVMCRETAIWPIKALHPNEPKSSH